MAAGVEDEPLLLLLAPPQAASVTAIAPAARGIMSFFMPFKTPARRGSSRGWHRARYV